MSILGWLKSVVGGEEPKKMQFAEHEHHFGSLDMRHAIEAHMAWKERLEAQIRGDAGETLQVALVAADHNCPLGKWIHGEGKDDFGSLPEYAELRKKHAEFHLCAGSILSHAHDGNKEAANQEIRHDLRHHSDAVQLALVRLYAKAQEDKPERHH